MRRGPTAWTLGWTALAAVVVTALASWTPVRAETEGAGSAGTAAAETRVAAPLLRRVVVVGASVSSGFLLQNDVGAPASLCDVLEAALVAEHEPLREATSLSFFLAPLARGGKQIDRALAREPTLVLALDFLFWFGYGYHESEEGRLEKLEEGLWLLDRLDATVVVADFPDMSPALEGRGPFGVPMLRRGQIPSARTLELLNAKLRDWAEERENVVVVPLAGFVAALHRGEAIDVRGNRWDSARALLREDLLHTTLEGSAALLVLAFDALAEAGLLPEAAVRWDARAIARHAHAAKEQEREKVLERQRRREERRREPDDR